ncbi:MAG TPA: hypothetical protein VLM76_03865 [Patescibacteria group bacterium]|nr:hypothetical protein [Patescibacteria group bacterium]
MTTKDTTPTGMRSCTGSARFGIEPHEAPVSDFPAQPSRKDGLGVMCAVHWKAYVKGLTADRKARAASAAPAEAPAQPTRVSRQQRRAEAQAAGKVPAADGSVVRESEGPAARRRKLEARLKAVGVESDEGQRILEAAGAREARGRASAAGSAGDAG